MDQRPFRSRGKTARLVASLPVLDSFIDFPSSKITLLRGPWDFLSDLTSLLCVNGTMCGTALYVDGGNSIDPYAISAYARRLGMDSRKTLEKILVSRAFTAYQFETIIHERLSPIVKGGELLVVSCIPDLFFEVGRAEGGAMLSHCLDSLASITREKGLITVLTQRRRSKRFDDPICDGADEVVDIDKKRGIFRIHKQNSDDSICYRRVPRLQTTLEEFNG
jgi:hypothetical protein